MGPARSGGPPGLDPGGECSNNPEDGHRLGGNRDLAIIVERRIRDLASRAYTAEQKLKQVDPGVIKLAEELAETKRKLSDAQDRAQKAVVLLSQ
ncbi:TPA: hypothetical protein DHW58_01465 [Patescibacteria group bacterium]|nr:hypothetical protein [Patescibacteria group bacterium]HCL47640.1 hypothetical protein [Patescibacteria group bacterium]HCR42386.1 hypothetical protein [Patescibacteria group bacterium]